MSDGNKSNGNKTPTKLRDVAGGGDSLPEAPSSRELPPLKVFKTTGTEADEYIGDGSTGGLKNGRKDDAVINKMSWGVVDKGSAYEEEHKMTDEEHDYVMEQRRPNPWNYGTYRHERWEQENCLAYKTESHAERRAWNGACLDSIAGYKATNPLAVDVAAEAVVTPPGQDKMFAQKNTAILGQGMRATAPDLVFEAFLEEKIRFCEGGQHFHLGDELFAMTKTAKEGSSGCCCCKAGTLDTRTEYVNLDPEATSKKFLFKDHERTRFSWGCALTKESWMEVEEDETLTGDKKKILGNIKFPTVVEGGIVNFFKSFLPCIFNGGKEFDLASLELVPSGESANAPGKGKEMGKWKEFRTISNCCCDCCCLGCCGMTFCGCMEGCKSCCNAMCNTPLARKICCCAFCRTCCGKKAESEAAGAKCRHKMTTEILYAKVPDPTGEVATSHLVYFPGHLSAGCQANACPVGIVMDRRTEVTGIAQRHLVLTQACMLAHSHGKSIQGQALRRKLVPDSYDQPNWGYGWGSPFRVAEDWRSIDLFTKWSCDGASITAVQVDGPNKKSGLCGKLCFCCKKKNKVEEEETPAEEPFEDTLGEYGKEDEVKTPKAADQKEDKKEAGKKSFLKKKTAKKTETKKTETIAPLQEIIVGVALKPEARVLKYGTYVPAQETMEEGV